jgi:hypothetical protein
VAGIDKRAAAEQGTTRLVAASSSSFSSWFFLLHPHVRSVLSFFIFFSLAFQPAAFFFLSSLLTVSFLFFSFLFL